VANGNPVACSASSFICLSTSALTLIFCFIFKLMHKAGTLGLDEALKEREKDKKKLDAGDECDAYITELTDCLALLCIFQLVVDQEIVLRGRWTFVFNLILHCWVISRQSRTNFGFVTSLTVICRWWNCCYDQCWQSSNSRRRVQWLWEWRR